MIKLALYFIFQAANDSSTTANVELISDPQVGKVSHDSNGRK